MPGNRLPGRREPVRGDTSLSSLSSSPSPSPSSTGSLYLPSGAQDSSSSASNHSSRTGQSEMQLHGNHPQDAVSSLVSTNGQASLTPAAAVPISNRTLAAYFPPSPPSTIASADSPPASPLVDFGSIHLLDEPILEETYEESQDEGRAQSQEGERAREGQVEETASTRDWRLQRESDSTFLKGPSHHISFAEREKALSRATHTATSAMPDTPRQTPTTVSPAVAGYAHHPTASGQRFFCSLFEDFPLQQGAEHVVGKASDAGIDLVCQGWSGAVLDQSRFMSHSVSSAGPLSNNATGRALFTLLPAAAHAESLREEVLSILDLASEELKCDVVFMAVDRIGMEESDWKAILHGLCYVGGSVVATGGLKGAAGEERLTGCKVKEGIVLVAVEM